VTVIRDSEHIGPFARHGATGDTAAQGRDFIRPKAKTLRQHVLDEIEAQPGSPEQIHARLHDRGVKHLLTAIRPRCSELSRMGMVKDSGRRALGESQRCKSIVWEATSPDERSLFAARKAAEDRA
jgi:hypothetical protein